MGCSIACLGFEKRSDSNPSANNFGIVSNGKLSRTLWQRDLAQTTQSASSCNEDEIDLTHFKTTKRAIGVGGFGVVRVVVKVSGKDRGTYFALKSLNKATVLARHTGLFAVMSELKTLVLLQHSPFVCNIHYAFQDPSYLYMVIDLGRGGDLRWNLRNFPHKRFPEDIAMFYFCQVAFALNDCHKMNILHRDVKPENIIMMDNGYIKLTDFGVAKHLENVEECHSTSGTHGYMAPEIYLPLHRHGTSSDWFALGITLYEFLFGRRPFETSRLTAFRDNPHNHDNLNNPHLFKAQHVSDACKDFIACILHVHPSRRLGGRMGIEEIRRHKWLKNYNWSEVYNQTAPAPLVPDVSRDRFEIDLDDMKDAMKYHFTTRPITPEEQKYFAKYQFRNRLESRKVKQTISSKTRQFSDKIADQNSENIEVELSNLTVEIHRNQLHPIHHDNSFYNEEEKFEYDSRTSKKFNNHLQRHFDSSSSIIHSSKTPTSISLQNQALRASM